jgi:arginyl-tRNA synthetase
MKFKDGVMSTRQGKVIFLEDVLNKSVEKVKEIIRAKNPNLKDKDQVAEQVGVGAIIFWDLSHDRVKDLGFDWEALLDFSGETGPYVQYTYARASAILRKAKNKAKADYSKLTQAKEAELIKTISDFEGMIENAVQQYKPSVLAKYLVTLSQRFNEFYQTCPVLNEEDKSLAKARLNLVSKTKDTIKEGLGLLAISTPEEM